MENRESVNWYRGRLPRNEGENQVPLARVDFVHSRYNELHLGEIRQG